MNCAKCGAAIADDAVCPGCGIEVIRVPAAGTRPGPIGFPAPTTSPAEELIAAQAPEYVAPDEVQRVRPVAPADAGPHALRYAGFWLRAVAFVVDMLLISIVVTALLFTLQPHAGERLETYSKLTMQQRLDPDNPAVRDFTAGIFPIWLIVGWLYYTLLEGSAWQATPGKKLLGLRVTNLEGKRTGFPRAAARSLSLFAVALLPLGFITYGLAGFTRHKQALHDMISGCLVLRR